MKNIDVSIIIVKYKCDEYLIKCVESIKKHTHDIEFEIIIIDNDKENIGLARAWNKGAKKAKGKYLLFLNPDTILLNNSIKILADFLDKNNNVGIVGPKLFNSEKKDRQLSFCRLPNFIYSLFAFSPLKSLFPNNFFWKKYIYFNENLSNPLEVEVVSGAVMMIKKNVFEEVGGFDEKLFLYFEENDLSWRLKIIGFINYYIPQAEIIHFGGKSSDINITNKYYCDSRKYFFNKYFGKIKGTLINSFILFLEKI